MNTTPEREGLATEELAARRFEALIAHSLDMILVLQLDATIVYMSPSAERQLGYAAVDVVGRKDFDTFGKIHPEDRFVVARAFAEVVAREKAMVPLSLRVQRVDGTWIDVEAVATNQLSNEAVGGVVVNLRDISERKRLESEASAVNERYKTLVAALVYGVMLADGDGNVVLCNDAVEDIFGVPPRRLIGRHLRDILGGLVDNGVRIVDEVGQQVQIDDHPLMLALSTSTPIIGMVLATENTGQETLWWRINARQLQGQEEGKSAGVVASIADITATKRASAALEQALSTLRQERTFLQVVLDNLEEGIVACDADGRLTQMNPASRKFHGISEQSNPKGRIPKVTGLRHMNGTPMTQDENPLLRALAGEPINNIEMIVDNRHGDSRVMVVNAQSLVDEDGKKLGAVAAMHDVSEHKHNEKRLEELALHDPLTGVANRLLLDDRIHRALERLRRTGGGVATFLLDLDRFKEVNDRYGHETGDEILRAATRRLQAVLRPQDTVARLGGDEFVVVCEVERGISELHRIETRIASVLDEPYMVGDRVLVVKASVGGVLVDDPDVEPNSLLSMADLAMYRVKAARQRRGTE